MLEIDLNMTVEEPNSVRMCVDDGDEIAFGIAEAITIKDHNILDNRDLPDQHPISAITGLAEALAQSGKIDTVKRNGVTLPVVDKAVNVEVPTKTSDLTNDSGFITIHDVPTPEAELFPVYITNITEDGPDLVATFSKTLGEILVALQNQKYPIIYGTAEGHTFSFPINSMQIISENPPSYFLDFWGNGESINKSVIGILAIGGPTTRTGLLVDRDYLEQITASDVTNALGYTPYQKPASGIPKTDLAQSVQTSLGKADTAIQQINYDLGSPTFDADGYFALTQTQADAIQALWNNGLCSVSLVKNGITYLAFKDDTQTLNGVPFLIFVGNYYDASQGMSNVEVGRGFVAISTLAKMGIVLKYPDLTAGDVSDMITDGFISYKNDEEPLPRYQALWTGRDEDDVILSEIGINIHSLFQSGRGARLSLGISSGASTDYVVLFLNDSTMENGHSTSSWTGVGAQGAIYWILFGGPNYDTQTGQVHVYNQTRAITNAEIDAICI